jgi:hypothetical protein
MTRLLFLLSLLPFLLPENSSAQYIMLGNSREMQNGCIQLTADVPYAEGIAYNETKLDLSRYFQIEFDIYLGNKQEGADGIVFVVHDDPRGFGAFGNWGECMGYGRFNPFGNGNSISPSIAIEFDTYQNPWQNDPESDHIAYLQNGVSMHENYWNGDDMNFNLEDDRLHSFFFRWDPKEKSITVILDGDIVYNGKKDLVKDIFGGKTQVIWGFAASTGRAHNHQYFCLRRLASNK